MSDIVVVESTSLIEDIIAIEKEEVSTVVVEASDTPTVVVVGNALNTNIVNEITTSTSTDIVGILKGTGLSITQATAGTDYLVSTATGVQTFLTTPSSANLASMVTDETGSGNLVFGTSPTFTNNIVISNFGVSGTPTVICKQARNTEGAPQAVQSGDILSSFEGRGYGATGFSASSRGMFRVNATETWSDTAQGASVSIWTTPSTTNVPVEQFKVGQDGHITLENVTSTGATGTGKFVFDTAPVFVTNITTPIIKPLADSTTAVQITKADGTTGILTVDTSTPEVTATAPIKPTIQWGGVSAANISMLFTSYADIPRVVFRRSDGTIASPAAVGANSTLLNLSGRGYDGTASWNSVTAGGFNLSTEEAFTSTAHGTKITFNTVANGTTSVAERMRINNRGAVLVNQTTDDAANFVQVNGSIKATAFNLADGSDKNYALTVYASGTVYTLTDTPALLTFGTTSPTITINKAGTYRIAARAQVKRNNSTHIADHTITFKLRRTNNTAADIVNATTTYTDEAHNASNETEPNQILPEVIYTTANTNDVIELWGSVSSAGTGGTHDVDEASILVTRLY